MGRHSAPDDADSSDADPVDGTAPASVAAVPVPESATVAPGRHEKLARSAPPGSAAAGSPPRGPSADAPTDPLISVTALDALLADAPTAPTAPTAPAAPVAPTGPSRPSRAGRNLGAAIGVGVVLGAAVLASLWVYRPSFVVLVAVAMAYGTWELTRAIGTVEARPPLVPLLVGGLAMDLAAWFQGANGLVGGFLLTVVGLAVWRVADPAVGYLRDVSSAVLIALYLPLLGGFAVLLVHPSDGAGRVITFIVLVVCSDVGGYTSGVFFGRHPMAPTVSPKKSWEGFAGSLLACAVAGALFSTLLFHRAWWPGVLLGAAIAVTATLGDLGESMIKRDLGLKDMGRVLPGHGGLMDRLDSLLPCAAVAYLVLSALAPV
ncbi:MAG: phosphatidate cytidylyltransferase [bacterium]